MFSGIVEELGRVLGIRYRGANVLLEIKSDKIFSDVNIGDSVAVNGVCLTAVGNKNGSITFEVIPITLSNTNIKDLHLGSKVNLERSLKTGDRISGHFVTGHIDCVGIVRSKNYINNNLCFEVAVPLGFMKYCLDKGSIAVDGISLTIAGKKGNTFKVCIIPHTLKSTTLGFKGHSDRLNIEFDILAKKT